MAVFLNNARCTCSLDELRKTVVRHSLGELVTTRAVIAVVGIQFIQNRSVQTPCKTIESTLTQPLNPSLVSLSDRSAWVWRSVVDLILLKLNTLSRTQPAHFVTSIDSG